jgi:hypothetical protein
MLVGHQSVLLCPMFHRTYKFSKLLVVTRLTVIITHFFFLLLVGVKSIFPQLNFIKNSVAPVAQSEMVVEEASSAEVKRELRAAAYAKSNNTCMSSSTPRCVSVTPTPAIYTNFAPVSLGTNRLTASEREIKRQGNDLIVVLDGFHVDIPSPYQQRYTNDLGILAPGLYSVQFRLYFEGELASETTPYEFNVRDIADLTSEELYGYFYGSFGISSYSDDIFSADHGDNKRLDFINKWKGILQGNPSDLYASLLLFHEMDKSEYLDIMHALPAGDYSGTPVMGDPKTPYWMRTPNWLSEHGFIIKSSAFETLRPFSENIGSAYRSDCDIIFDYGREYSGDYPWRGFSHNVFVMCNTNNKPIFYSFIPEEISCYGLHSISATELVLRGDSNCHGNYSEDEYKHYDITSSMAKLTHTRPDDTFPVSLIRKIVFNICLLPIQIVGMLIAIIGFITVKTKKHTLCRGEPVEQYTIRLSSNILAVPAISFAVMLFFLSFVAFLTVSAFCVGLAIILWKVTDVSHSENVVKAP